MEKAKYRVLEYELGVFRGTSSLRVIWLVLNQNEQE